MGRAQNLRASGVRPLGEEDRVQPFENLEKAQRALRKGEFFSVRNAGHFFQEEKADILSDMIDKYILYGGDGV